MTNTIKNRELFPVGTRVKPYAKLSTTEGTVVEHNEKGNGMYVRWDDSPFMSGPFAPQELRRA